MNLDTFLVTLGIKGQNAVLSTIDTVQKKGKELQKSGIGSIKMNVPKATGGKGKPGAAPVTPKTDAELKTFGKNLGVANKGLKDYGKAIKDNKAVAAAGAVGGNVVRGVAGAAAGASSLDPTSFLRGVAQLPGEALSGIPFFGGLAKATSAAVGMSLDAANNALSSAKTNADKQYSLIQRNAASAYYGGEVKFAKTATGKNAAEGSSEAVTGRYSPQERAELIASVSGAFGKIKGPLAETLSGLIQSGKYDARSLSRVASGDWRSSGTDQGFFLQKIADQFGDLPPSIAQKFQSSLLEKYGESEIQQTTEGQKAAQTTSGAWQRKDEALAGELYNAASKNIKELLALNESLNKVQINLVSGGSKLANVVDKVAGGMNKIFDMAADADAKKKGNSARVGRK